jgi:rubrerythrin
MTVIETAIKMEQKAIAFYNDAAEKTDHPFGKRMFLSFVDDEKDHLCMLRDLAEKEQVAFKINEPKKDIRTIFDELKDEMIDKISATTDEIGAIRVAMDMEKEGFHYYEKIASESPDERERALFERLAHEEEQHFRLLENTFEYLNDTGNWFMWEEYSIVEG